MEGCFDLLYFPHFSINESSPLKPGTFQKLNTAIFQVFPTTCLCFKSYTTLNLKQTLTLAFNIESILILETFYHKLLKERWSLFRNCFQYVIKVPASFNPAEFLIWNNPPPFFEHSIINFMDIKMRTCSWLANSTEPGQIAWMCRLAWLYTGGKG